MTSAARGTVHASAGDSAAEVQLTRDSVGDDAWDAVVLAAGAETTGTGKPATTGADVLVRRRQALKGALRRHGLAFAPDESVRVLLVTAGQDDQRLDAALQLEPAADLDPDGEALLTGGPFRLMRELRPFQRRDLARLLATAHGANFSVPGAGKTTVSYAVHAAERARGRVGRLLVVAPLSAFGAWQEDAVVLSPKPSVGRWSGGPLPSTDVVLVNYQRLGQALPLLAGMLATERVHLVVDEAHRAKRGAAGEWGRSLLRIGPLAARRDILTGTPAPNHPRDLASLLEILWPGGAAARLLPAAALRNDPPPSTMADVNRAIRPLYARTTKTELDLPPVRVRALPVPLGRLQQDIYDAMLSRYKGLLDLGGRDAAMFAQLGEVAMYLLQAASSPRLLATTDDARAYRFPPLAIPAGSSLARLVETYADHEVPAKIAAACRLVYANATANPPRKTLVWSNFPDNLLDLEQQLAALNPALVYGSISSDPEAEPGVRTREREIARFRSDGACLVLLANPAALAEGVSLHDICHDAVYIDRTFNAGQYLQSLDRIHRLGLRAGTHTNVTVLVAENTVDERVDARLRHKTARLSQMLDDPGLVAMALPDEDDNGPALDDDEDFLAVLAHLGGSG